MPSIISIRHGETDWNIKGRYQGQADPPLNSQGLLQAQNLVEELLASPPDILYTSPLLRTRQTADILNNSLHIQVVDEPRLMEIHQGDWQTRLRSEIETLYPELFSKWETDPWKVTGDLKDFHMVDELKICHKSHLEFVVYAPLLITLQLLRLLMMLLMLNQHHQLLPGHIFLHLVECMNPKLQRRRQ